MVVMYVKYTCDEYKTVEYVADSCKELARICGVKPQTISREISRAKHDNKTCCYARIEIEGE